MKKKESSLDKKITRKEAISRAGKYAAFTAASMMTILNPVKGQYESSPELPPEWYY
jgi:lipopolysaccharide export system protein LptC